MLILVLIIISKLVNESLYGVDEERILSSVLFFILWFIILFSSLLKFVSWNIWQLYFNRVDSCLEGLSTAFVLINSLL